MFVYEKKLEYPVRIRNANPALAKFICSQYGGPDGELGASLRYLSQRYAMPYPELSALLTDIGREASEMFHSEATAFFDAFATVSSRICTLVLLPQTGHSINFSFCIRHISSDLWQNHKRKIALAIVAKESRKSLLHFCWVFDTICER